MEPIHSWVDKQTASQKDMDTLELGEERTEKELEIIPETRENPHAILLHKDARG